MRYLKRKIDLFLAEWKAAPNHKPLIVKGPRQVGKTESVQRFAQSSYENVIYINFVEEPKYKLITADGYKTDEIIKNISRLDPGKRFLPGKTLLFFDELQEFPDPELPFIVDENMREHASDFHQLLTRLPAELFAPVVIDDQPASHKRLIGQMPLIAQKPISPHQSLPAFIRDGNLL